MQTGEAEDTDTKDTQVKAYRCFLPHEKTMWHSTVEYLVKAVIVSMTYNPHSSWQQIYSTCYM